MRAYEVKPTVSVQATFCYEPEELRFVKLMMVGNWRPGGTKAWMRFRGGRYNRELDVMMMKILAKQTRCFLL